MTNKNYTYDVKCRDNILILGQTNCWKTTFLQNLAGNNMFGELTSVDWISKINLNKNREEQIALCFQDTKVNFRYPNDLSEFNALM